MSDQINNQQGYPQNYQQVNQQGYPQQQYQQMNQQNYQQGYVQQPSGQDYQQNFQQGQPQMAQMGQQMMNQGYPQQHQAGQVYSQQGYVQQPQGMGAVGGGTTPPKKTGLIVGIIIGVIVLIAGIILLIFKDKIFGGDDDKKKKDDVTTESVIDTEWDTTEATTDITVDIEGGYDTPEELFSNFWEGYDDCDKDQIYQCFYLEDELAASSAESNYNSAVEKQDEIQVYYDEITTSFEDCDVDEIPDIGVTVVAAKQAHVEVPMIQIVDGDIYDIKDIYDGTIFQLENGKWYMGDIAETDVEVLGVTSDDTSDVSGTSGNTDPAEFDETYYLGYGDLKTMGDSTCGYVDVPSDWVRFEEIGGTGADYSFQTSNVEQTAIITMCAWDSDQSAYDAASSLYENLSAEGTADEVVSAQATIGDYDAYQVYAVYGNEYLVTYCFRAEDDRLHYVAVEMPEELINICVNVEGSFRFTE